MALEQVFQLADLQRRQVGLRMTHAMSRISKGMRAPDYHSGPFRFHVIIAMFF
jgi:hypothetical protein